MSFRRQDVRGYLAVLRFRGGMTVLVEGATDKRALARALHEFERAGRVARGAVVVDSVDSIDVSGAGVVGNRAAVEHVHAAAVSGGHKCFAMVDREFNGFVADEAEWRDELRTHHQPSASIVWTRGHSIENYFFEPVYVQEFLRYRYADRIAFEVVEAIAAYWDDVMSGVAALSVAARDAGVLSRLSGALSVDAWVVTPGSAIGLDPSALERAALARKCDASLAAAFRDRYLSLISAAKSCGDPECARWIAHGHIGDEAMWLAVGRILRERGAESGVVHEVAHGFREEKRYHRADRWAQAHRETEMPIPTPSPLWRAVGVTI